MTDKAVEDVPLGKRLIAKGWRQGSRFECPGIELTINEVVVNATDQNEVEQVRRPLEEGETLVLVSHDCDIRADPEKEPYVEAMICRCETDQGKINNADHNSVRKFLIDRATGLIVSARHKAQIPKSSLLLLKPSPWPSTPRRLRRFSAWLGRRYDRAALPDDFVESFQQPAEKAINKLFKKNKDLHADFSRAVREICLPLLDSEHPPFRLDAVTYLLEESAASAEEVSAIQAVHQVILDAADTSRVILPRTPDIVSSSRMSLAEYENTWTLFLEYVTYKGEEVHGAGPVVRS